MVNTEISCVGSSHMQVKEIRYSTKKCSICKKRCLFRIRKMVKCVACKCTVHKRCLAAARSELRDNFKPTVANGQWDEDVIPETGTGPVEKLSGAEVLSLVERAPETAADKPTEETRGYDIIQPVIAFSASTAPVMKTQKPTKSYRSAVASGHLPLLRLRLIDTVSRVFGPAPVQIHLRRDIFMSRDILLAVVSRLQLQAAVSASIKLPRSALMMTTAFAETKDKATDEIHGNGKQLVIAFSVSTAPVMKAQKPTNPYISAVASGHLPLLRLRLIDTVSRVFGPAPVQIQLRRDIFMSRDILLAVVSRLQLQAAVSPSINLPLSALMMITAFAETKDKTTDEIHGYGKQMVIAFSVSTAPVIKVRKQTNPYRSAVASGHVPLLRLRLIDTVSRVFGPAPVQIHLRRDVFMATISHLRLVQLAAITPPVMPSIKTPPPSLETITAFDCLKLVWGSLSSEKKEFLANVQRLKIAPAPLFVKSKLTALDYSKLSEPWFYKRIRYNDRNRKVYSITYTNSQFQSLEDIDE